MRMQLTPSPALGLVEPVVFAPKAMASNYSFRQEESLGVRPPLTAHPAVHPTQQTQQQTPTLDEAVAEQAASGKRDLFTCPEVHCGKQFPRSFALRRHMRIHTGNKPYACEHPGCSQRFNTSGNLSRHKRIHSGERPYPCVFETCGKRFNTSTKLKRHMKIHFPDGHNLFRCVEPACSWACDNYKEYVQHQKLHRSVNNGFKDENVDSSNMSARRSRAKKTVNRAASPPQSLPQPQPTFHARQVEFPGSPRALESSHPAQMQASDDYYQEQERSRLYGLSGAPSALMMMQKDEQHDEPEYRRLGDSRGYLEDQRVQQAPRLPFPTRAFPSESMASAMPSSGLLGGSFHLTHLPSTQPRSYFEPVAAVSSTGDLAGTSSSYASTASYVSTSAYPSYLRGNITYQSTATTSSYMTTSEQYGHMRADNVSRGYGSPESATSSHTQHDQHSSPHHPQQYASGGSVATGSGMHQVAPEFTGEELSAVLELMKDS